MESGYNAPARITNQLCPKPSTKRARINVLSPALVSALDCCKVSDRKAVYIATAAASSVGKNVAELNINRSSIRRARNLHLQTLTRDVKVKFLAELSDIPLTIHWDGKLLPDLTGKQKVDHLPIIVSGSGNDQLLAVPKLPNGTGEAMAGAIVDVLQNWGIKDRIFSMSFDTTSSNTGIKSGACTLLEKKIGKRLFFVRVSSSYSWNYSRESLLTHISSFFGTRIRNVQAISKTMGSPW